MEQIQVLDNQTIDKIAAGEVVERPMSVVKELVENAIDSGADAVTVEIKNGGIDFIRVTDNGCGIEKQQVPIAFLRHATSKIHAIEDLLCVKSLGFRGEALSSIAAVAKVELLTKTKSSAAGTRYVIEGAREMALEDVGVPDGTTFIVRNLFYNTPARRKFLKTSMTEGTYIVELMERILLSHPEISFKLIVNGSNRIQTSGNGEMKDVIYQVFGRDITANIVPLSVSDGNIQISGFVGKPDLARSSRSFEVYYVNQRYIKSSLVSKALDEAYKPFLMLHKYPFVVLYLSIPAKLIDINVHPAKMEIRFLEAEKIYQLLVEKIREALSKKELIPEVKEEKRDGLPANKPAVPETALPEPFEMRRKEELQQTYAQKLFTTPLPSYDAENRVAELPVYNAEMSGESALEMLSNAEQLNLFEERFLSEEAVKKHRIIGQLFETYWLVELSEKLYIIDQHAAHEKVLYERIKKKLDDHALVSQLLNPPTILSLSKSEEQLLERFLPNFEQVGFEIEHFGGNEYSLRAVPAELFRLTAVDYFHELLDELSQERLSKEISSVNDRIATMACKSAVKGNNRLSMQEAQVLIDELLTLDNPYHCPHGRPTIISYSKYELEKKFKRIV
ncbi:MAG: DNA mismatch repair endonuclease MutL [Lachnospiraceae bacterium]